jgi:hypothetical protein
VETNIDGAGNALYAWVPTFLPEEPADLKFLTKAIQMM